VTNIRKYGEGSVLKDLNMTYPGKRHKSWLKCKAEETVDVTIIGFKEGQGKYTGLIGAITFRAPDGTIGNCSGMTDDDRVWISDHRVISMGSTIEIKHYGMLVDGFRHPQFIRFRKDK
jgi:DNA ligase-1